MLHVKPPSAATIAPSIFDPIACVAHFRERGIVLTAREIDGQRSVALDIANILPGEDSDDPRLCIATDPDAMRKIWEVLRAEQWIAGARECGLVVAPWREIAKLARGGVLISGSAADGSNEYSAASHRFLSHPAANATDGLREGLVFEVLCADLGLDPDDPDLCAKVNDHCRKSYAEAAVQ